MRTTAFARPTTGRVAHRAVEPGPAAGARAADPEHHEAIVASHERCMALGVSRIDAPDLGRIARSELSIALERNRRLHDHAAPVMEMLHEQIARTESMVVLTDALGTVIHAIGDDDFLGRASQVALRTGVNWSEGSKGTNAVGTALVDEKPTLVHADEHFLHANSFLTCSAAPIQDPRGNMLGVLDVSGDFRSYHKHTLALVRISARMIENRWLSEDFGHAVRVHFHSRPEFIGTLMEGLLAVTDDGRIVGANRGALEQLSLSGASVRKHSLETLFGTTLGELADHSRHRVATPLQLRTADGRSFCAFARGHWGPWAGPTGPSGPSGPSGPQVPLPAAASVAPFGQALALASTNAADAAQQGSTAPRPAITTTAAGRALAQLRSGDAAFDAIIDKLQRVLDRDIPILIVGETGTGKETLARAIHADSARAARPFVAVHVGTIVPAQLEAELFGLDEGLQHGTRRKATAGKIQQAHGGTLFVDDVGELPLPLQAQLLRLLQERHVASPHGGAPMAVDVALVCASRSNLRQKVEQQAFREDLYYRLNGLAVRLPPLRERSDLPALALRLLGAESGARRHELASEVMALFERYGWPGNLRQLHQVLRSAAAMAAREPVITRAHLPDDLIEEANAARMTARESNAAAPPMPAAAHNVVAGQREPAGASAAAPSGRLDEAELALIKRTLDEVHGNISEASKRLGISRNTIYRKLRWKV